MASGSITQEYPTNAQTATRNTTNAPSGTCTYFKIGKKVFVHVADMQVAVTGHNDVYYTGLPNAAATTVFLLTSCSLGAWTKPLRVKVTTDGKILNHYYSLSEPIGQGNELYGDIVYECT